MRASRILFVNTLFFLLLKSHLTFKLKNFTVQPKKPLPIFRGAGVHIVSCRPFQGSPTWTVKYRRSLCSINLCLPNVLLKNTTAQFSICQYMRWNILHNVMYCLIMMTLLKTQNNSVYLVCQFRSNYNFKTSKKENSVYCIKPQPGMSQNKRNKKYNAMLLWVGDLSGGTLALAWKQVRLQTVLSCC